MGVSPRQNRPVSRKIDIQHVTLIPLALEPADLPLDCVGSPPTAFVCIAIAPRYYNSIACQDPVRSDHRRHVALLGGHTEQAIQRVEWDSLLGLNADFVEPRKVGTKFWNADVVNGH